MLPDLMVQPADLYNVGISMELTKKGRTLPMDHPDRSKFILEAARLKCGKQPNAPDSALKDLAEPYQIPHQEIKDRMQLHEQQKTRWRTWLQEHTI